MLDSPSPQARLGYALFSGFPMSHATLPHPPHPRPQEIAVLVFAGRIHWVTLSLS